MPKTKERDGVEYWKGKFREVQKENQHLKKRIRQLEKNEHMYEEVILGDKEVAFEETVREEPCFECGKGKLKVFNVLDRIFVECNICNYRKKIGGPFG